MNDYEKLIEAKNKIGKLRQVKSTHLCGGGTIDNMVDYVAVKTHDGLSVLIKPEDADKADEIINQKRNIENSNT